MQGNVTKELAAKVACPVCKKAAVIREPGKYRCSACGEKFRAALDAAGRLRVTLVATAAPPIDLEPPRPSPRPSALCARHPRMPAYESCVRCGDFTCASCMKRIKRRVHCPDCAQREDTPSGDATPAVGPGLGDILAATFTGCARSFGRGLLLTLPAVVVAAIGGAAMVPVALSGSLTLIVLALVGFVAVVGTAQLVAQVGMLRAVRAALAGGPMPSLSDSFAVGVKPVLRLAWSQAILVLLMIGLGFAVGVIPVAFGAVARSPLGTVLVAGALVAIGVLVMLRYALVGPVVVYEERSGLSALRRSSELVGSRMGTTIVAVLFVGAVVLGLGLVDGLLNAFGLPGTLAGIAVNAGVGVLVQSLLASLYWGIRARN